MPKILIVDDDPDVRDSLRDAFESQGLSCVSAGNGREAAERLDISDADVILTDYRMPLMNGLDFLRHLAASPDRRIPVIVMSGESAEALRRAAFDLGAFAVVEKPYDTAELIDTVFRAIRSTGTPTPRIPS
jgi:CheY-like chemotaxis protein